MHQTAEYDISRKFSYRLDLAIHGKSASIAWLLRSLYETLKRILLDGFAKLIKATKYFNGFLCFD